MPGDQRDRLVADRTIRHQQRGLGPILLASPQDLGRVHGHRMPDGAVGREPVEPRRQRPEEPPLGGAQRRQGEPAVGILHRGVIPVDRDMGNPQIVIRPDIAGIDLVEFCRSVVGRPRPLVALAGLIGRRGGDQRQFRL